MPVTTSDLIDALNDLTEGCKDSQYGYSLCAERAHAPGLKALLGERALEASRAAAELQALVVQLGGEPDTGGSLAGAARRSWTTLRDSVAGPDDLALLDACERAEDSAYAGYRSALKEAIPTRVQALLERLQRETLQRLESVRTERERLSAGAGGP